MWLEGRHTAHHPFAGPSVICRNGGCTTYPSFGRKRLPLLIFALAVFLVPVAWAPWLACGWLRKARRARSPAWCRFPGHGLTRPPVSRCRALCDPLAPPLGPCSFQNCRWSVVVFFYMLCCRDTEKKVGETGGCILQVVFLGRGLRRCIEPISCYCLVAADRYNCRARWITWPCPTTLQV